VYELMALIILGALAGCFTGLLPGIHVNNVVIVLLSLSPLVLSHFDVYQVTGFIIAMAVVHTFVDFIPSIFLGAPQEDSVLSVLPGHRMLLAGRGYDAVRLTVVGGVGASAVGIALLPMGLALFSYLYSVFLDFLPWLLALVILYMVLMEGEPKKMAFSLAIVAYSGALGVVVLDGGVLDPAYALFPTLTGLFGLSTLLLSLRARPRIPPQHTDARPVPARKGVVIGAGAGLVAGLVPSIGTSQSALVVQNLFRGEGDEEFLVALGGVNTTETLYAFLALYLIGNPRSGASIAVERMITDVSFWDFLFMVGVVMAAVFPAVVLTLGITRLAVRGIEKIDYPLLSKATTVFLVVLIGLLTGWKGILVAATATAIGIATPILGVKRSHCMGVLMVPTILYFL